MRNAVADVSKSVRALPECFSQLIYLGSLRNKNGEYEHWGLTREYGEEKTRNAFAQTHLAAYERLLQMRFSGLIEVLQEHCAHSGMDCRLIVDHLSMDSKLTPSRVQEHSAMHFNYVLASLLALSQSNY